MPVYIITGKLGGGKSLVSVSRIKLYLERGAKVATNLDLNLLPMFNRNARNLNVVRLPDKPKIQDLDVIGRGNESYDESKNGLLVLDECGTWFNSRNWNDKERKPVNDWFLHARKLGWDVLLIIQNISMLDSQARDAIAEHTVFCKRLDRFSIPYLSPLWKALTGNRLPGPKVHSARVVYGVSDADVLVERWVTYGSGLYACYDTKQTFLADYPHGAYSLLTPWHLRGRYFKWSWRKVMQVAKVFNRRFRTLLALGGGAAVGVVLSLLAWPYMLVSMQARAEVATQLSVDSAQPTVTSQPEVGSSVTDGSVSVPSPVLTVREQFSTFSIVAHVRRAEVSYYQVRNADGAVFTDAQLRAMGYRVFPVSECELMVVSPESFADKATIWQPGCMVRQSAETRDLSQVPSLARTR